MDQERLLAAVLLADVVGSTPLYERIGDVKHSGPDGESRPEVDIPYAQLDPGFMNAWARGLTYVVRGQRT